MDACRSVTPRYPPDVAFECMCAKALFSSHLTLSHYVSHSSPSPATCWARGLARNTVQISGAQEAGLLEWMASSIAVEAADGHGKTFGVAHWSAGCCRSWTAPACSNTTKSHYPSTSIFDALAWTSVPSCAIDQPSDESALTHFA